MEELTWAQIDALEAERRAKVEEVTHRLARVLSREFDAAELRLIWGYGSVPPSPILVTAFERARSTRG
jgi:hypothetical protein